MLKINFKNFLFFLIVVLFLFGLHFFPFFNSWEEKIISWVSYPVHKTYSRVSSWQEEREKRKQEESCRQEKEELIKEKNELLAENSKLRFLKKENEKLRKYLDFFENKQNKHILARVISQGFLVNPEEETPYIIINKGSEDGVEEGLLAVNSEGIAVGKISKVRGNTSQVLVITHHNSQLAATVQNENETSGIVEGDLGLTMKMKFIPQTEEINKGDLITTSGLEKNISPGSILGRVISVGKSSDQMWQEAVIEPLINFRDLSLVAVLAPTK